MASYELEGFAQDVADAVSEYEDSTRDSVLLQANDPQREDMVIVVSFDEGASVFELRARRLR